MVHQLTTARFSNTDVRYASACRSRIKTTQVQLVLAAKLECFQSGADKLKHIGQIVALIACVSGSLDGLFLAVLSALGASIFIQPEPKQNCCQDERRRKEKRRGKANKN